MSQRVKRPNRTDDGSVPTKRRKRPTVEEEETASLAAAAWQPRPFNDLKSIYNRTATEAPAELFRKDLISAMKLPDSEPLASDEYWVIVDQWKQEWERGVQVPVNPDSLPEPCVTVNQCNYGRSRHEFRMPKNKYIRITKDEHFNVDDHVLSTAAAKSEAACSYDLDECDVAWLKLLNGERAALGLDHVTEEQLERVIERLEINCWDKMQAILRNEEGLGIEYDENVICDVCRSPDSEEGNEMVFCDSCNICVHQACYGITRIPDGQWLCGTCALSQRPECVLCPNKGGAMKATRSGQKWAHVSCALWIPEVSIGCVEKMEPITKISSIPQSRWALICVLCRERVGACIQCSVKTCKTAYHVTCAFKHGLEMRAIIEDENADDGVKLRSYCEKHSKTSKKEKSICSGSDDDDSKRKKRKDMTSEEKNQARAARLQEIEAEFDKHVSMKDVTVHLDVDNEALYYIYNYWKLKRRAGHNKPLLLPKSEDVDMLSHKQEQADIEKMKMFVQLRQDLERVRNLCYMVSRREKLSRTFFRMREQTFHKQAAVLSVGHSSLSTSVVQAVIEANHGPSIYDRLYSHSEAEDHTKDFDVILARIAGIKSPQYEFDDLKKHEVNGLIKKENPYRRLYFNGSSKRRSASLYGSSASAASSSDEQPKPIKMHSSTEDEKPPLSLPKKKVNRGHKRTLNSKAAERRRKRISKSEIKVESSSDEDMKKGWGKLSKSRLHQMEHELGISGTDSDELMPIRSQKSGESHRTKISSIYSDSDSSDMSMKNDDKSSNAASDSQQNRLRTKAAVKEFSQKPSTSKRIINKNTETKKLVKHKDHVRKESPDKKDYVPSDLIVPQRQAAKKASENMKSTSISRPKEQTPPELESKNVSSPEDKVKHKPKPLKSNKEMKPTSKKEAKQSDVFDIEKEFDKDDNLEILSYVPQRQAAKKAAEHIKSGLGKPPPPAEVLPSESDKNKKEAETLTSKKEVEVKNKKQPEKIPEVKRKSSSNSSTSSSSSTSTDSSSSSSSDTEDEPPKRQSRTESLHASPPPESIKRTTNAKDWPFLDKEAKSKAYSSTSDSSDSSRPSSPAKLKKDATTTRVQERKPVKPVRRMSDKKPTTPTEREEPVGARGRGRPPKARTRSRNSSDRTGDANVGIGDIVNNQSVGGERNKIRKGKSDEMAEAVKKEITKSDNLLTSIRKEDKNVNERFESNVVDLEREILERKAGRDNSNNKSKTSLDRLLDKKLDKSGPDKPKKSPEKHVVVEKVSTPPIKDNKESATKCAEIKQTVEVQPPTHEVNEIVTPHKNEITSPKIKPDEEICAEELFESEKEIKSPKFVKRKENLVEIIDENKNAQSESNNKLLPEDLVNEKKQGRSIFSPPHPNKETDLLDFDILDDGFGISKDEEIMKGSLSFSYGNISLFKEDSKEDSARETLNLVEKLRQELSKKSTTCDMEDAVSVASSTKNDIDRLDMEQIVPNDIDIKDDRPLEPSHVNLEMRVEVNEITDKGHSGKSHDYKYSVCEVDVPIESNKSSIQQSHDHLDHSDSAQADERWVPPSESCPVIQSDDQYNTSTPELPQTYVQQYSKNQQFNQHQILSQRVQEEFTKNSSPTIHDRRISQTPYLEQTSMDCMPSPLPYADIHPQAKWADSQIMPTRRSSSSSVASTSSSCSRRNEVEDDLMKRPDVMLINHPNLEMPFGVLHPFPPNSLDPYPPFSEPSQFVSPVSLFPPPNINTQIPFPSPGAAMFPPAFGAAFPASHSVIPPMPKPVEETIRYSAACTAAFTSSQHNMALTAAMVNLPPITPKETIEKEDPPPHPSLPSPTLSNSTPSTNHIEPSPNPSLKSNSSVGKKSPSKPTRTSARFISQQNKSPNKSPGISPKQEAATKQVAPDEEELITKGDREEVKHKLEDVEEEEEEVGVITHNILSIVLEVQIPFTISWSELFTT
ncbi:hypothetical protein RI129_008945 [Pyrocoelia pectoralis]|uniref:PHD finger protein rhinoceros n=1 Tax=Pyrocoelia pectoralis TaxID=417401 RepID=A0AAN7V9J3_9COLE